MGVLFLKGPSSWILFSKGTVPHVILVFKGTVPHVSLIFKGTASWDSYSERDRHVGFLFGKGPSHGIFIVKGTVAHDSNCAK